MKWKQPQIVFLQYSCSLTMINIVKKYMWRKIHELNTLIGCSQARNEYNVKKKNASYRITTGVCFHSFIKFYIQSFRFFQKLTSTSVFFSLDILLMERLSDSQKKSLIRLWATLVFVVKYVHIYDIFSHKLLN